LRTRFGWDLWIKKMVKYERGIVMKKVFFGVLLILVVALGSISFAENSLTPVRIAYHNNIGGASLVSIAQEKGYFKQEGLQPQFVRFSSGPTEITAMLAGSLDVGYIGPGAMFIVMEGRVSYIAVDSIATGDMIIGYPGRKINKVKDLVGKKVGIYPGTSQEMLLRVALKINKIPYEKVQVVPIPPENQVAAFATGQLDAVCTYSPYTGQIQTMIPKANVVLSSKQLYPKFIFPQGWLANKDFMKKNPQAVQGFLRAIMRANNDRNKDSESWIPMTGKFTEISADLLRKDLPGITILPTTKLRKAFNDGTVEKWLNTLNELFVDIGRLKSPIPASQYLDKQTFLDATKKLK
jgi:NitT/TauT family transport system substrate-binding protein